MSIQMLSISHKTAPMEIRSYFSFNKDSGLDFMKKIKMCPWILECVLISTCNRTEICVYSEHDDKKIEIFEWMKQEMLRCLPKDVSFDMSRIFLFYREKKAIHHLFSVSCGLDSMVIGEDQILGQVKDAHQFAMENHMCSTYLNTLFRFAITAAKKVKTDTNLSKTPVSTATICIKAAEEIIGTLKDKNVMLIGATGKIGEIVLKNLIADYHPHLYVTVRGESKMQSHMAQYDQVYEKIPYEKRYDYLKDMDVVISATSSPHYTLTYNRVKESVSDGKKMAFMDLAVPLDIESQIQSIEGITCMNMDDFSKTAHENNVLKLKEASTAYDILDIYENDFNKWYIFQQSLGVIAQVKEKIIKDCEIKDLDTALNHFFFAVREHAESDDLCAFMNCIKAVTDK